MNIAVIFAGGVGSRMSSSGLPKQFLSVDGRPIIVHTLAHFEEHPQIDAIAVAILPEWRDHLETLLREHDLTKVRWVVDGGPTGQVSRHRALRAAAADTPADSVVLIHDGVRPLIDAGLISANIRSVEQHGSGVTCRKFNETIVSSADRTIDQVIPRESLHVAVAPQSFRIGEILALYDRAVDEGETDSIDSCSLMVRYGRQVHRVDGPSTNIKITTAEDFAMFRAFYQVRQDHETVGT